MTVSVATIGFGEAARAFADDWRLAMPLAAYDRQVGDAAIEAAAHERGVILHDSAAAALAGSELVLSLVTADQALAAAQADAAAVAPGALWCDMNSVAPRTKHAAAAAIEAAGGRFVDVAVMAPVLTARRAVPLLVSGRDATGGARALRMIGFTNVTVVAGDIGAASAIKMIRSVMVKGVEALTAEMMLAADAAGVTDAVLASLGTDWETRADYNLERMMVHGLRRAAEMEEVARTLDDLGVAPTMTCGTIERQRAIGTMGIENPPAGLAEKLALLGPVMPANAGISAAGGLHFPETPASAGVTEVRQEQAA